MPKFAQLLTRARRLVRRGKTGYVDSQDYWESRYAGGGDSGQGSYGVVADYKAAFLNSLVLECGVNSVLEFGSGDGNQLSLAEYPRYAGLDVSKSAISLCSRRFANDRSKSFIRYDPSHFHNNGALTADMVLSLDVLLHLVEDSVFETYMNHIFDASLRWVVIFSPNRDEHVAPHVRYRAFTSWVERNRPGWRLVRHEPNSLEADGYDSAAEFFVFEHEKSST